MDPGTFDLTLYRGASFREHTEWYGPNSTPDNFAGYGAEIVLLDRNKVKVLHLTSGEGAVVFPMALGHLDIVLTEEQINTLPVGVYNFYLNLLPPVGGPIRALMGRATVV